jgi:hypothetical protein
LKKPFPEIPPVLPFLKGGELFPRGPPEDRGFPHLKKLNEGRLPAFQTAKMIPKKKPAEEENKRLNTGKHRFWKTQLIRASDSLSTFSMSNP